MLVLSRHLDERIMIGDDIVITVVDIRGDKIRLGIDAPKRIPVHRQEVYDAIQREKRDRGQAEQQETETWYGPGGTAEVLPAAEEVVARRKAAAVEIEELRAENRVLKKALTDEFREQLRSGVVRQLIEGTKQLKAENEQLQVDAARGQREAESG